jgi:hypothetical protein
VTGEEAQEIIQRFIDDPSSQMFVDGMTDEFLSEHDAIIIAEQILKLNPSFATDKQPRQEPEGGSRE